MDTYINDLSKHIDLNHGKIFFLVNLSVSDKFIFYLRPYMYVHKIFSKNVYFLDKISNVFNIHVYRSLKHYSMTSSKLKLGCAYGNVVVTKVQM